MNPFQDSEIPQGPLDILVVRIAVSSSACERETFETATGICKKGFDNSAGLCAAGTLRLWILVVSESLLDLHIL